MQLQLSPHATLTVGLCRKMEAPTPLLAAGTLHKKLDAIAQTSKVL